MMYQVTDRKGIRYEIMGEIETLTFGASLSHDQALMFFGTTQVIEALIQDGRLTKTGDNLIEQAKNEVAKTGNNFIEQAMNKIAEIKGKK